MKAVLPAVALVKFCTLSRTGSLNDEPLALPPPQPPVLLLAAAFAYDPPAETIIIANKTCATVDDALMIVAPSSTMNQALSRSAADGIGWKEMQNANRASIDDSQLAGSQGALATHVGANAVTAKCRSALVLFIISNFQLYK